MHPVNIHDQQPPTQSILCIAVPSPLRRLFDYLPPVFQEEHHQEEHHHQNVPPSPGTRYQLSFGGQKSIVGILIRVEERPSAHKLKAAISILDNPTQPAIPADILRLCEWCAEYYHYPLGEVCHLALPTLLRKTQPLPERKYPNIWQLTPEGERCTAHDFSRAKKQRHAWEALQDEALSEKALVNAGVSMPALKALQKKGLAHKQTQTINNTSEEDGTDILRNPALPLNQEQRQALNAVAIDHFACYLLDGVTGSGKTEVYLQAIERVIAKGQQVLVLVPEIGLTPQTVTRFEQRFKRTVATIHSGMNDKQRLWNWQDAKAGRASIVIGTRSSVFTPFPNLGLIIIDEEHDLSYKQQEGVRYSARDTAIVRAQQLNIPVILGSATPSLETLQNALASRFTHLRLTTRATQSSLPSIKCIDSPGDQLSPVMIEAIRNTLDQQQQVLIFINRRGFAPTLMCQDCHWTSECTNCDSRMTIHKPNSAQASSPHLPHRGILHCHYCDTKIPMPKQCPSCHSPRLQALGQGTQRSEQELGQHFPDAPILRIDRDNISKKGDLQAALDIINSGNPCIMIGTQMLAKGHHFAKVSLAIMLGIDSGFFSSDFRGSERMAQLLTQVAGRAGRESHQGQVLLQTEFEDHPLLRQLIDHGYSSLSQQLIQERKLCGLPPFRHMAFIRCHAHSSQAATQFLLDVKNVCELITPPSPSIDYIGPLPASIEKRSNRYYYYLQIKADKRSTLHQVLHTLCQQLEGRRSPKGVHWLVDVDPQET